MSDSIRDVKQNALKDVSVEGRENVEYSTPMTVTSQFYFCGIPFRVDTYRGCSHMCKYCFANTRKSGTGFGEDFKPACAKIEFFEKIFKKAFSTDREYADVNVEFLRHRVPIHLGGMSDPFQHRERNIGISYQFLKLLKDYDYPVAISTKNKLFTEDKYFGLLGDMKAMMQVSIINENNIPDMEPKASSVDERFKAVKLANQSGIPAHIRLQPFIPGYLNINDYVQRVADAECPFVTVEHLKLPLDYDLIGQISKTLGYNIKKRMNAWAGAKGLKAYGREFELPPIAKYNFLFGEGKLVDLLHKNGIKYGAADNQLHQYNDSACCCGVDLYKGFENYFKANYTHLMATQKDKDRFTFDDLLGKHWMPKQDINDNMNRAMRWNEDNPCRYVDAVKPNKLEGSILPSDLVPNKIYYHLRNKWHNPELNDSPTDLFLIHAKKTGKKLFDKVLEKEINIDEVVYVKVRKKKEWF